MKQNLLQSSEEMTARTLLKYFKKMQTYGHVKSRTTRPNNNIIECTMLPACVNVVSLS